MKNLFFFIALVIFQGCSKSYETLSGFVGIANGAQVRRCMGSGMQVEFEWNVGSAVQVKKLFDCFSLISSNGASFSVQLCVDVASNLFPMAAINWKGRPGHAFLIFTKRKGATFVKRVIGYSSVPNDNINLREVNGSISMDLNEGQFHVIVNRVLSQYQKPYDLVTNNCVNFALDVFNYVRTEPIKISPFNIDIPVGYPSTNTYTLTIDKSPQMLFEKLLQMKLNGDPEALHIKIGLNS